MLTRFALVLSFSFLFALALWGQEKAAPMEKENSGKHMGYVVDAACAGDMAKKSDAMKYAEAHTKKCALREQCAASGYGLFEKGKWYKFDKAGDELAKGVIEKTAKEKAIMVEVAGTLNGDTLAVTSIKEHAMGKTGKKHAAKG